MKRLIDINADLGEGFGAYVMADDASMLKLLTSANIACGFHAGDPRTMVNAVKQAMANDVGIGAHPGFPDLVGFGRRDMNLSPWEVTTDLLYQIGALYAFVKSAGGKLQHVSPHGRLANVAAVNQSYADAIAEAIAMFDPELIVATQHGELVYAAHRKGLRVANLIFADRAYEEDGSLVTRNEEGSVIHDPELVVQRCVRMVVEGKVTAKTGRDIEVTGHSLCIHGDTAGSIQLAAQIKQALTEAGVEIRKLGDWLK